MTTSDCERKFIELMDVLSTEIVLMVGMDSTGVSHAGDSKNKFWKCGP